MYFDVVKLEANRRLVAERASSKDFDIKDWGRGLTALQKGFMEAHLKRKGLLPH